MDGKGDKRNSQEWPKPARGVRVVSGQATIVFVTVRARERGSSWLANERCCTALEELWRTEATAWRVGLFVLMPDHMHFLAGMRNEACLLADWMRFWKRRFGQVLQLPSRSFQELHWDTRIRSQTHYMEISEYIRENPVRAGLVSKASEWPFTRVVHELEWFGH